MSASPSPPPWLHFDDDNGAPLAFGTLKTFAAGSSTPLATYTDSTAGTPNPVEIMLDARGEAAVWLSGAAYKFELYDADDVLIRTADQITSAEQSVLADIAADDGSSLIGFLQSGTGARARTVQDKERDIVSVLDFGATRSGALLSSRYASLAAAQVDYPHATTLTDTIDWAAVQGAMDALAASGGVAWKPPGNYSMTDTLTMDDNHVFLLGTGLRSQLVRSTDYGDTILITGNDATGTLVQNVGVSHISFVAQTNPLTSGSHIHVNGASRVFLDYLYMQDGFNGFDFAGVGAAYCNHVFLTFNNLFGGVATNRFYMRFRSAAATYSHPSCADFFLTDINMRASSPTATVTPIGIDILSADGIWFDGGHVGGTTTANIRFFASDADNAIGLVFFNNFHSDASTGVGVQFSGTANFGKTIKFTGFTATGGTSGTNGIQTSSDCTFYDVEFSGHQINSYKSNGVVINSPNCIGWSFTGGHVQGNSANPVGVASGYNIQAGDRITITGGRSGGAFFDPAAPIIPVTTAGSFVVARVYVITSVGTTDFTLIGAASNTVGVSFTATGAGTGTGTALAASVSLLTAWAATTPYVIEDIRRPTVSNTFYYRPLVAGTSGGSEPTWPTTIGASVVDGSVTWVCSGQNVASQIHGIVLGSNARNVTVTGVDCRGNVLDAISIGAGARLTTRVSNCQTSESMTVASAAAIALPTVGKLITISGSSAVTSITAAEAEREVILLSSGTPTLTDGSNLKLAGNFVMTADDTIRLICDGTNWHEQSRSIN